jgi:menaquinone-dependent protoporphyrinogen oxidase
MKPIGILYATREGHTRRIAEHVETRIRNAGFQVESHDLRYDGASVELSELGLVILLGPIHAGRHPRELLKFVKANRERLGVMPTTLLTVCLAQAGIDRTDTPPDRRTAALKAVKEMEDAFIAHTGLQPTNTKVIAGALPYTQYNFFIRWVMKRIVAKEGGDTDTSKDYEYTDWVALDRWIDALLDEYQAVAAQ